METDVLIIGSGSAGCAAAIELAKRDVSVTLITTTSDVTEASSALARSKLDGLDGIDEAAKGLQEGGKGLACPRATEQFSRLAPAYLQDFLVGELKLDPSSEKIGSSLMQALQQRMSEFPQITVLTRRTAIDLITLEKHSSKASDVYKKPTCLGAYVLNEADGEIETWVAKETILATGGFGGIFLHSNNPSYARGDGIAMAVRAGARLVKLSQLHFHPLNLLNDDGSCTALPEVLWEAPAKIRTADGSWIQAEDTSFAELSQRLHQQLQESGEEKLWLDLTECSQAVDAWDWGSLNPAEDLIPVVPAAQSCLGGIAVDRHGQTSISRLHAIGQVACTGLFGDTWQPGVSIIAAMLWGQCCADDVAKQINKFAYYSPELKPLSRGDQTLDKTLIKQHWLSLKHSSWNGLGPWRRSDRVQRSLENCQQMLTEMERNWSQVKVSSDALALRNALQTATILAKELAG